MKRVLLIILIILILGVVIYFMLRPEKKDDALDPFPLKHGSQGPEVGQLQKYLIKEFGAKVSPSGKVDNWWHDMTETAVQTFLKRDNISRSLYYKFKMDKY
jgi:hypothetical protein